jgi:hypothetical protein
VLANLVWSWIEQLLQRQQARVLLDADRIILLQFKNIWGALHTSSTSLDSEEGYTVLADSITSNCDRQYEIDEPAYSVGERIAR